MTLFYPDVSNLQWSNNQQVTDWCAQLLPSGFAGAAHKVSEGDYYTDRYWPVFRDFCAANSIPFIGYHYVTGDNAASQAQLYVNNGGSRNVMLDIEANSGDMNNVWNVVNAFNDKGINVQLVYLPKWYWGQIGSPDLSALAGNQILLVSSSYPGGSGFASSIYAAAGGDGGQGWASYGGCAPAAWQFSDKASIAGLNVDVNAFRGTDIGVLFGTASSPAPPVSPGDNTGGGLPTDDSIYSALGVLSAQWSA